MIFWIFFLFWPLIRADTLPCCIVSDDYFSCGQGQSCSCSSFKNSYYLSNGDCYVYSTGSCCIYGDFQKLNNYCPDCSCKSFTGACMETSMEGSCYVYEPCNQIGCCNNQYENESPNIFANFSCTAKTGECQLDTNYDCWVMSPCSYEGCCLVTDPYMSLPTTGSCSDFKGASNLTLQTSTLEECWVYLPSIPMNNSQCGCANVTGNCTCESESLSCNITFFDNNWGIIPPGAIVIYRWYPPDVTEPVTESYTCPIDYSPPNILITIICIVICGALALFFIYKKFHPASFTEGSIFARLYRVASIMNMLWPGVHLSVTMGYLYYLLSHTSFTAVSVTGGHILVNSLWFSNANIDMTTVVNTHDCYVISDGSDTNQFTDSSDTDASPPFTVGYPGVVIYFILTIIHTGHTVFKPENKKTNYLLYCLALGVNLLMVPFTWYAWDYCYSLLPVYTGGLHKAYWGIFIADCACISLIMVVWICVCFGLSVPAAVGLTVVLIFGTAVCGFVYKILTYLQLALRYFPKLVLVLDVVYHVHFISSFWWIRKW